MQTLVVLTTATIEESLRDLPSPWSVSAAEPAGATRGRGPLEGPVGAWLDFYGIVRDLEPPESSAPSHANLEKEADVPQRRELEANDSPCEERRIVAIEYEAHPEMARHQLELLAHRIAVTHELQAILVIHRIGRVPVGEPSLLVRTLSGHRGESLRACAELIDELKKWVPIWKHPIFA